jgi:single-strand DNA-binding protein
MAYDIKGIVHLVSETKQVSEKFQKRPIVLEVADGKYPQFIEFEATGDRCSLLDGARVGDTMRITFNIRGRKWDKPGGETRYFVSLDIWKVEIEAKAAGSTVDAKAEDTLPF